MIKIIKGRKCGVGLYVCGFVRSKGCEKGGIIEFSMRAYVARERKGWKDSQSDRIVRCSLV